LKDLGNPAVLFASLYMDKEGGADFIAALQEHEKVFGRLPSQEDIKFYKSMIQDIQIHRPD
jgi:hypothetical protein